MIPCRCRRPLVGLTIVLALAMPMHLYGAECPRVTVCFTPGENCTQTIVQALGEAKRSIQAQAYSFTSAPIAQALLDAHKRGVQVQVILDKSQRNDKYSSADFLSNQDVPVVIDANHAIAHNKIISHRWRDGPHRQLQLYQSRPGEERGEPVDYPRPYPGRTVHEELGHPSAA